MSERIQPRLPYPAEASELGVDEAAWDVLVRSIFPSAKSADAILLAIRYCRVRGWDPFHRVVHVVPVWDRASGREVETVWPGIQSLVTEAHRTGSFVGVDGPVHGPIVEVTAGRLNAPLEVPEWTRVTVRRLTQGIVGHYTGEVWWREAYGRRRDGTPTEMWLQRPRQQAAKCATAAALRLGFPEAADYAAEEMEGQVVDLAALQQQGSLSVPPARPGARVRPVLTAAAAEFEATAPAPAELEAQPSEPQPAEAAALEPEQDVEARRAAMRAAAAAVRAGGTRQQLELVTATGEVERVPTASAWLERLAGVLDETLDPAAAVRVVEANDAVLQKIAARWPDAAAPLVERAALVRRVAEAASAESVESTLRAMEAGS